MKFRFFLNLLAIISFLSLPVCIFAQSTWTCCRIAVASKNVCDSLSRFRTDILAAVPATDTVCNLALNKLCRSRISDDSLSRILTLLKTYPMLDRILFLNDIHGINNIPGAFVMDSTRSIRYFVDSLTRATVNAWRICRTRPLGAGVTFIATMRLDWDVLKSVARDTNNRTLKNALWIRNLDRYDKLLSNYRGSCNTCRQDSTVARLPRLSRYLDTVAAFALRYGIPPNKRIGFDSFMTQEGSARGVDKPDGAFHLMRDLASPTFTDVVISFESRISEKMPV